MYYHKLNQVVTPITVALSDVVSLLEQINIFPGDRGTMHTGPLWILETFGSSFWS